MDQETLQTMDTGTLMNLHTFCKDRAQMCRQRSEKRAVSEAVKTRADQDTHDWVLRREWVAKEIASRIDRDKAL